MTELDRIDVVSGAINGVNASRSGISGNDQPAGTLADQARAQELVFDQAKDEQEAGIVSELGSGSSCSAGDDDGIGNILKSVDLERKTESVNKGFDVGTNTENVDVRTENNEKFPVGSGAVLMRNQKETVAEKASVRPCGKVVIDKEVGEDTYDALEREMAGSHGINRRGMKDSKDSFHSEDSCLPGHVIEDENGAGSSRQDAKGENPENLMDVKFVGMGLKPHLSKDKNVLNDVKTPGDGDVKATFDDSDLVWAKVRSHPWWPGQIFDSSAASEKAKKYFKKGRFLVAYFGDHTFAWNDASRIKPFWQHFSQMERQSRLAEFRNAIDCALEEVSRRMEFGLACPCVSEEVYNKIKTQTIINPGIREDSCERDDGQRSSCAKSFEPKKIVEYIRSLACSPSYYVAEKLKFVTQRAQLLAYHRWKGYPELPRFETLYWSLKSAPKKSTLEGKRKKTSEVTVSVDKTRTAEQVPSKKTKLEDNEDSSRKQKHGSEDKTAGSRTENTLSEFIAERRLSKNSVNNSDDKSGGKSVSDKKRNIEYSESWSSAVKVLKNNKETEDSMSQDPARNGRNNYSSAGDTRKLQTVKPVFRVGASILKVASQMNSASPVILKPGGGSSERKVPSTDDKEKSLHRETPNKELAQTERSSLDEMLSCLHSAAKNPKEKPSSFSEELEEFLKQASSGNIQKESVKLGALESRDVKDTTEEQVLPGNKKETADIVPEIPTVKDSPSISQKITGSDSLQQLHDKNSSGGCGSDDSCKDDFSEHEISSTPNALILKFADLSSVPSEENLNKIFSRYGPLRESETQLWKKSNRAKVVFRRGEDAETAFSSAGKYSIFGPSLLSYRLSYVASKPSKARKPGDKNSKSTNGSAL